MGFTERQDSLVKESWEIMKQNIPQFSLRFLTLILETEPATKGMFSFMTGADEIPERNPQFRDHAIKIFKMVCEAAIQLRDKKGEVVVADTTLKLLGSLQLQTGVMDPHFEAVKEALLKTVKEAIGHEKWSEEMEAAWAEAYDQVAAAILNEIKLESASFLVKKLESACNS